MLDISTGLFPLLILSLWPSKPQPKRKHGSPCVRQLLLGHHSPNNNWVPTLLLCHRFLSEIRQIDRYIQSPSILNLSTQLIESADFAGGTNFVVLAIITLAFSETHHARQIVVSIFIMLWGARLSAFLLFRILKTGKDDRFDDKRDKFFPFLGFWVFQMLWVWTVSLPVTVLNSPNITQYPQPAFGTGRDIAGVILFAIGFIMESVSDVQKYLFRSRNQDKSAICDKGFFSWTRHPNYFGEIIIQFCKAS